MFVLHGSLQLIAGAAAGDAPAAGRDGPTPVPVTLIEWQGCPDCSKYGDGLVQDGLKKGLGKVMGLSVFLRSGAHPGIANDPDYQPWVACANNVTGTSDDEYWWFQVAACANPGRTVQECIKSTKMPASLVEPIQQCMSDTDRASMLVAATHRVGDTYKDFPWPLIGGKASLPEPDTHGDNIGPLIKAVCEQAASSGAVQLPEACNSVARLRGVAAGISYL